jgi:hypothetical protein
MEGKTYTGACTDFTDFGSGLGGQHRGDLLFSYKSFHTTHACILVCIY